jgi:hypothetical protein
VCDKGYASKTNREAARKRGIAPVIPHKAKEKDRPAFFAKTLYKARAHIEQGFGRLKRFKRAALRCEKTERNFRSIVSFAAGLCSIQFVHMTYGRLDWQKRSGHNRRSKVEAVINRYKRITGTL